MRHITDSDFEAAVKDGITVIDFWASWCGPCVAFAPTFEAASKKYKNISFGKYEVTDENKDYAAKFGIRSIPSVLAFKDGNLLDTKIGLMNEGTFQTWLEQLTTNN